MTRTSTFAIVALLGAAAAPPPASATVLLAPPPRDVAPEHPVYLQLWYRSADGGPRHVTISVLRDGKPIARRKLVAPTQWRTYTLVRHAHPGTYTTKVVGPGWRARYRTRVM